jgi:hypothetical protein
MQFGNYLLEEEKIIAVEESFSNLKGILSFLHNLFSGFVSSYNYIHFATETYCIITKNPRECAVKKRDCFSLGPSQS